MRVAVLRCVAVIDRTGWHYEVEWPKCQTGKIQHRRTQLMLFGVATQDLQKRRGLRDVYL